MRENNDREEEAEQNLPPRDEQGCFIAEESTLISTYCVAAGHNPRRVGQIKFPTGEIEDTTMRADHLKSIIGILESNGREDLAFVVLKHGVSDVPLYLAGEDLDAVYRQISMHGRPELQVSLAKSEPDY